jgi:hypothetical protein
MGEETATEKETQMVFLKNAVLTDASFPINYNITGLMVFGISYITKKQKNEIRVIIKSNLHGQHEKSRYLKDLLRFEYLQ